VWTDESARDLLFFGRVLNIVSKRPWNKAEPNGSGETRDPVFQRILPESAGEPQDEDAEAEDQRGVPVPLQHLCPGVFPLLSYKKNQFCCYCHQIYQETSLNADVDGKDWIGCDTCERWVHIECEQKKGIHQIRKLQQKEQYEYQCLVCRNGKSKKIADNVYRSTEKKIYA